MITSLIVALSLAAGPRQPSLSPPTPAFSPWSFISRWEWHSISYGMSVNSYVMRYETDALCDIRYEVERLKRSLLSARCVCPGYRISDIVAFPMDDGEKLIVFIYLREFMKVKEAER